MSNDNGIHGDEQDATDKSEDTDARHTEDETDESDQRATDQSRDAEGEEGAHDDETHAAQSDDTSAVDRDAEVSTEPSDEAELQGGTEAQADAETPTYQFDRFGRSTLPPNLQYTPEFDDDWIYPTGTKDGATRDDIPVQGLELGVVASPDELRATIEGVLSGLESYYDATGVYPRHRIVASEESFETVEGIGLVAAFQPRPDEYDGLISHMNALETEPDALTPNRERARLLAAHLNEGLAAQDGLSFDSSLGYTAVSAVWPSARLIGGTPIIERYAPLAAGDLYDPTEGEVDLDGPGLDDVTELSFDPDYLDVSSVDDLPATDGDATSEEDGTTSDEEGDEAAAADEVADRAETSSDDDGSEDDTETNAEEVDIEEETDDETEMNEGTDTDSGTTPPQ